MAAGKSSRINRQYKTKYRIRNWREYERGLRSRGDVTIWLSEDAIAAWIPPKNGLRGGQRRYSNLAIRTALTLRVVFGLPLRQTEGFARAVELPEESHAGLQALARGGGVELEGLQERPARSGEAVRSAGSPATEGPALPDLPTRRSPRATPPDGPSRSPHRARRTGPDRIRAPAPAGCLHRRSTMPSAMRGRRRWKRCSSTIRASVGPD